MKKGRIFLIQLLFISFLTLSLVGSSLLFPTNQPLTNSELQPTIVNPKWVYMVYCDADNNLDSYGVEDVNEMESGYSGSSEVKVIVFLDREYSGAKTYQIIHDTSSSIVSTILTTGFPSEPNMGAKATLKNFISYVFNNHPADHYLLDLWDHGGGIMGACWDDTDNDHLTFDEMDEAITEACTAAGKRIDILAFDACLVQLLELEYEIRESVDYMVASEETIPGYGYPYDDIISSLCASPSQTALTYATDMVNDYYASYSSSYDITLSAVDVRSAAMNSLLYAFNLFTANISNLAISSPSTISAARAVTQEFYYTEIIDLKDFALELASRVSGTPMEDACDFLNDRITNAVKNNKQRNNPGACGIAIYFPESSSDYDSGYASTIDLPQETNWDAFLSTYYYGTPYKLALDDYIFKDPLSLDADNDNDGIVEQRETINVSITIMNTGTVNAAAVNGTLSCADANINMLIGFQTYGSMNQGTTKLKDFQFSVSNSAPSGLVITFTLLIRASFPNYYEKYETLTVIINISSIAGGSSYETAMTVNEGIFNGLMPGPDPTDSSAWFKIFVPAGKYLVVTLLSGAGGSDFDIYVYSPYGELLTAAIGSSYPDPCSTYIPVDGEYVIRIYPYDGSGAYTLSIDIADSTGPEDGLSYGTAISLSSSVPSATGTLPAPTSSGGMWFRVYLDEGETVTFRLYGDSSQNDFDLYLCDNLLNDLAYSIRYDYPEEIQWTAEYSGYHYLFVDVWDGSGDFEIEVQFSSGLDIGTSWITITSLCLAMLALIGVRLFVKRKN